MSIENPVSEDVSSNPTADRSEESPRGRPKRNRHVIGGRARAGVVTQRRRNDPVVVKRSRP